MKGINALYKTKEEGGEKYFHLKYYQEKSKAYFK